MRLHYAQAEKKRNNSTNNKMKPGKTMPHNVRVYAQHQAQVTSLRLGLEVAGKQSKAERSEQMSKGYDYHSGGYYSAESTISFA